MEIFPHKGLYTVSPISDLDESNGEIRNFLSWYLDDFGFKVNAGTLRMLGWGKLILYERWM